VERSDTHRVLNNVDGFRKALNPSYALSPDRLFDLPDRLAGDMAVQPLQ
jgi:hypothetical protein